MIADRMTTATGRPGTGRTSGAGTTWTEGAAVHPRFLRFGPWVLSLVAATLFVLSFATSYAALHDYARQLEFGREFAIVFPLVLDAVISVLAVTVLLERAMRRRTVTVKGWQFALRLPTWPLVALWVYFGGSVAGNVAHAPPLLAAQLVAAVPPVSAALTFHLLLRLLDRAPALREIAEAFEERSVEERERAARRRARRAELKARTMDRSSPVAALPGNGGAQVSTSGADGKPVPAPRDGHGSTDGHRANATERARRGISLRSSKSATSELVELRQRVQSTVASGDRVTGETVGLWLGVSARTGRRRLAALFDEDPSLAATIAPPHGVGQAPPQ